MSYESDVMMSLKQEIRNLNGLKEAINVLNENVEVFERLALAIEKQNQLLEQQNSNNLSGFSRTRNK